MANASFGRAVAKVIKSTTISSEEVQAHAIVSDDLQPLASLDEFHGDPNFMMSLARGLLVIQAFSERRLQLSISQLSKRTALSRASVRRCLHTLSKLGFAGTDDGRSFYLRPRVLALGHSYLSSMPLATAAQPILR